MTIQTGLDARSGADPLMPRNPMDGWVVDVVAAVRARELT